MGLPRASEGLCETQKRPTPCRLLAPCRDNGNQTSIIAPTTQEGQDRGKAGAGKEHCLIDEQIHLERPVGACAEGGGRRQRAGKSKASTRLRGYKRVTYRWLSGCNKAQFQLAVRCG